MHAWGKPDRRAADRWRALNKIAVMSTSFCNPHRVIHRQDPYKNLPAARTGEKFEPIHPLRPKLTRLWDTRAQIIPTAPPIAFDSNSPKGQSRPVGWETLNMA